MRNVPAARCAAMVTLMIAAAAPVHAQSAFQMYGASYRPIEMPPVPSGSFYPAGAALADGRLLVVTGLEIRRESSVGSGIFELIATLDGAAMGGVTDAAFLRVSPDGSRIAVGGGAGRAVAVFSAAALPAGGAPIALSPGTASYFSVPHYDAAWADNSRLAISAGVFGSPSQVTLLDTLSAPAAPSNRVIIANINGASAGLAFDAAGRLYTGNGLELGPGGSTTGTLRAFDAAVLDAPVPIDFETSGTMIGAVLSATSLSFDLEGNLFVGGGNFGAADFGYLGVVSAAAIGAALGGSGPIDPDNPAHLRRLAPSPDPFAFYGSAFNPATGEAYVTYTDFATGATVWYATIPAPGAASLVLLMMGASSVRRRCCA